jgi:hypothetical protein
MDGDRAPTTRWYFALAVSARIAEDTADSASDALATTVT